MNDPELNSELILFAYHGKLENLKSVLKKGEFDACDCSMCIINAKFYRCLIGTN